MIVRGMGGFTDDAKAAFKASPDYFLFWDRLKTNALVLAFGAFAFLLYSTTRR